MNVRQLLARIQVSVSTTTVLSHVIVGPRDVKGLSVKMVRMIINHLAVGHVHVRGLGLTCPVRTTYMYVVRTWLRHCTFKTVALHTA